MTVWTVQRCRLSSLTMASGHNGLWGTSKTIADFTAAGFATFTFDYRHYGESSGKSSQLLNAE